MGYKLKSDSSYREDMQLWIKNDKEGAQKKKEELEDIQRNDAKLRNEYEKIDENIQRRIQGRGNPVIG